MSCHDFMIRHRIFVFFCLRIGPNAEISFLGVGEICVILGLRHICAFRETHIGLKKSGGEKKLGVKKKISNFYFLLVSRVSCPLVIC